MHVSHLNADPSSQSKFYRSKAEGDELVKQAFEGATIVRPAAMYGAEDKLLNNMAGQGGLNQQIRLLMRHLSVSDSLEIESCADQDTSGPCKYRNPGTVS